MPIRSRIGSRDRSSRSDSRATLCRLFDVDAVHVVVAALHAPAQQGDLVPQVVADAIDRYSIDAGALERKAASAAGPYG
jgi:pyruvate dehydrogenase E1 component